MALDDAPRRRDANEIRCEIAIRAIYLMLNLNLSLRFEGACTSLVQFKWNRSASISLVWFLCLNLVLRHDGAHRNEIEMVQFLSFE